MTNEKMEEYCNKFMIKNGITNFVSMEDLMDNTKFMRLYIHTGPKGKTRFTIGADKIIVKNGKKDRKRLIIKYLGERDMKDMSEKKIRKACKEMILFSDYMRKLRAFKLEEDITKSLLEKIDNVFDENP